MNASALLESLNLLDEHERVEAKRCSEVGRSLGETVCAFANEPGLGGGWIALGVTRDDMSLFPSYAVEGIENPDQLSAEIANQCRDFFNVPIRVDISTEHIGGKVLIVVFVPEAQPHDKPVFFKATGLPKGAFRRIGSTDQKCTEDDLAIFYQSRQVESFDCGLVLDASLDDILPEAVLDYRQARAEVNPDAEELRWSEVELLQALGCIRKDSQNIWRPTVAGMMLFGKPQALRRCFPMTRVDYIRESGRDWVQDVNKRFDTIEIRDPLFRLIRRTQAAILDDLPKSFGLDEGALQRQDKPVIPLRVIREAVVNALMHRSYRSHSPIQIIRYPNRLEIRNPGFSLKSIDHLGEPGSQPRNPKIAAVLHETRFAETKGSGIRVMREIMEQAGLTPPLFESDRGADQFVARYFFHHFLGEQDIAWLSQFRDLQLSPEEAKALVIVREAGAIDNATYRDVNKVDVLNASSALRRLRDAGLLEQKGKSSATYYVPTKTLLFAPLNDFDTSITTSVKSLPLSTKLDGLSTNSESLSTKLDGLSTNLESLSTKLDGLSTNLESLSTNHNLDNVSLPTIVFPNDEVSRRALLALIPENLVARVDALGRRSSPDEAKQLIWDICFLGAWRAEELAILLRRNSRHVRNNYIRPLLREKKLEMTNIEGPNDPLQTYRSVWKSEGY
ncbi:MAG: ATP-binding protein [Pseudomonadota bacterium]